VFTPSLCSEIKRTHWNNCLSIGRKQHIYIYISKAVTAITFSFSLANLIQNCGLINQLCACGTLNVNKIWFDQTVGALRPWVADWRMSGFSFECWVLVFYVVLYCSVCFCFLCTGHFSTVPLNLTCLHCKQHFFFEHLNLYYLYHYDNGYALVGNTILH